MNILYLELVYIGSLQSPEPQNGFVIRAGHDHILGDRKGNEKRAAILLPIYTGLSPYAIAEVAGFRRAFKGPTLAQVRLRYVIQLPVALPDNLKEK